MYAIYALIDPRNNQVRYVGMTGDIYTRFIQHLKRQGNNGEKNAWIDKLRTLCLIPTIQTLEIVLTEQDAREREAYWIFHYMHLSMPLTNEICLGLKQLEQERDISEAKHDLKQRESEKALKFSRKPKDFTPAQRIEFLRAYIKTKSIKRSLIEDMHLSYGDYQACASRLVQKMMKR
jgi:hypothetical protein